VNAGYNSETATTFIRPRKVPGYSNLNLKAALYIRWSFTKIEEGFFDFVSRPEIVRARFPVETNAGTLRSE
jgi:hypothetical protein